jgi:hypothetical protein
MFSRIKKLSQSINKKFILTALVFAGPVVFLAFISISCGSWDKTVTGPNAGVVMTATAMGFTPTFTPMGTITPAVSCVNPPAVVLNSASTYIILSAQGITDVTASAITGNIGNPAGTQIGVPCSEVTGNVYCNTVGGGDIACENTTLNITTANTDALNAYTTANGVANCATNLNSGIIGGLTLSSGKYYWSTGVTIPTNLHLDAEGNAGARWIMQVAGNLVMSSATTIFLDNGALASNVVWTCAGAVTIGTTAQFEGTVLCQTAINVNTGANVQGKLLAQTAVNLQQASVHP